MKVNFILVLLFTSFLTTAQIQTYTQEIEAFQKELNEEFKNPEESPLTKKEQRNFKGHDFFPIDTLYKVSARLVRSENPMPFAMKTTTDRAPVYEKYGDVVFNINGKEYTLSIYQSHRLRATEKYKDYLFLPFTDATNGETSYGGGRYLDLSIPDSNEITLDFNKVYNPYCAYSHTRSCPIPPKENDLPIAIKAGVRMISE